MKLEDMTIEQLRALVRGLTAQMSQAKGMLPLEHPVQNALAYDLDNIQAWQIAPGANPAVRSM